MTSTPTAQALIRSVLHDIAIKPQQSIQYHDARLQTGPCNNFIITDILPAQHK